VNTQVEICITSRPFYFRAKEVPIQNIGVNPLSLILLAFLFYVKGIKMKIFISKSEGLGYLPYSLFVKIDKDDNEILKLNDIYTSIVNYNCDDIIFYGDVINPLLDWVVPRLLSAACSVTYFTTIPLPTLSNKVITFIKPVDFKKSLQSFKGYREQDIIIVDADTINEIKYVANILRNEQIKCALFYNGDKIKSMDIINNLMFYEIPFFPSDLRVDICI